MAFGVPAFCAMMLCLFTQAALGNTWREAEGEQGYYLLADAKTSRGHNLGVEYAVDDIHFSETMYWASGAVTTGMAVLGPLVLVKRKSDFPYLRYS